MKKYLETTLRLWRLLKPFHRYFYLQLFLILITQGVYTLMTLNISKIIDSTVSKNWNLLVYFLIYYLLLMIIKNISDAMQGRQEIKFSMGKISTFIQEYSLRKILGLNAQQYVEDHSAIRQQVVDRGEDALINIIETLLLSLIPIILTFTFSIIAISYYPKFLGLYSLLFISIVIIATARWNVYFRPFRKKVLITGMLLEK